MSGEAEKKTGTYNLLGAWFESSMDFWSSMMKMGSDPNVWASFKPPGFDDAAPGVAPWIKAMHLNQAMLGAMNQPEMFQGLLKGVQAFPDIALKLTRSAWDGYFFLQRQWLSKLNSGSKSKPYVFEGLDQNAFKQWLESYEKEIQPLFRMPQLGLTRATQEKINRVMDRYHVFQIAFSEFLYILYQPIEKSVLVLQEQIDEMAREGRLPDDFKAIYKQWIQTLEGHYMTLYQSPEYLNTLHNTLNSLHDFVTAQRETVADTLKLLSIPTSQDVDDMAHDIYQLKKEIRRLKRKLEERPKPA